MSDYVDPADRQRPERRQPVRADGRRAGDGLRDPAADQLRARRRDDDRGLHRGLLPRRRDCRSRRRSRSWSSGPSLVGLLMERIAYRPIRGAPDVAMLLTSFAVGQILQNGTLLTTRLAGHADPDRLPEPRAAERRRSRSGTITVPKVNVVSFVAGIVLLGLLTLFVTRTTLGLSMRAAAEDLDGRAADGDQGQPGRRDRVRDRRRAGRRRRVPVRGPGRPDQPVHGLHAGPQGVHRRGHRRLREHRRRGARRLRPRASSRCWSRRWPASATCCRRARSRPRSAASSRQWLPSSLASYRDAVVFIVLILVLLVRPQGILGRRDQGDL